MNNVTFAGRVGKDGQVREVGSDTVLNFSLAVDRFKKDAGPLWVSVALWGKRAEALSQYIVKGKQVAVSGSVDIRTYELKGETRAEMTLNANQVTLLGGGESGRQPGDEPAEEVEAEDESF